jgi:hypothetical protein
MAAARGATMIARDYVRPWDEAAAPAETAADGVIIE